MMMKKNDDMKKYNDIIYELEKYKEKDYSFSSGRILGSMCTEPHKISIEGHTRFIESNIGDPDLFPGTKEIESNLIKIIAKLLNAPKSATGHIVSGGTEGNITAMWMAKRLTNKSEIIIPKSAHFSFNKIASLMDMKLIKIPLNKSFQLDFKKVRKRINNNTAAILGIAGSTELGIIDPIPELSDICLDENIYLHVDAAFGGFVIPFLKQIGYNVPEFDFKLKGISSISIDAHKMGYSVIPLGVIVSKQAEWFDFVSVESHCINSKKQVGILGTRSGGPVAGTYAVIKYLGLSGYKKLVEDCMNLTKYTEKKLNDIGLSLIIKPTMNVLGVKIKKLSKVVEKLSEKEWKVNKIDHLSCIRIVIMPQITKKTIDEFIPDLKNICKELGEI
jgi:tyrosine decarboxylase/aspartate 1-decarboxylase